MHVPYSQVRVVYEQMLEEMLQRGRMTPKRPRKRSPGPRRRPIEHTLATLMVKFGRSLESFGQAHLAEDTSCSA